MKRIQCLACEYESCLKPREKCSGAVACFEFITKFLNGTTVVKKGCIDDALYVRLQCHFVQNPEDNNLQISTKCCFSDFCNDNPIVPDDEPFKADIIELKYIVIILVAVLLVAALLLYFAWKKRRPTKVKCPSIQEDLKEDLKSCDFSSNFDSSETSGSGRYGQPLLTTRTVSRVIYRDVPVYKGRTNEVYRGTWLGSPVAIKAFNSRDEHIFQRELEVYRAINKHENILEFIAADCISVDACTQQWLITNYYPLGSMYDFLNTFKIDQRQCLSILRGIINGLDYLHSEDVVPEIAHRDIKSKNILMKNDHNVCIADFGLAVTYYKDTSKLINAEKYKVGTIRYMPPEILSDSFNSSSIVSHKQADIYSLSLVMWEACRRCYSRDGKVDDYNLPFGGIVPSDPSFEDMKKVVCDDNQRPNINTRMENDPVISRITKIMQECWYTAPIKRLTSLRIKKSLNKIDISL